MGDLRQRSQPRGYTVLNHGALNKYTTGCDTGSITLLNNIPRRKVHWIGNVLRRKCLLYDVIEGRMTEVKEIGRRRTQLLDDLREEDIGR